MTLEQAGIYSVIWFSLHLLILVIVRYRYPQAEVKLLFAWYDLWAGVFVDRQKSKIYQLILPTIGWVIDYKEVRRD